MVKNRRGKQTHPQGDQARKRPPALRLDAIMKVLFKLSKKVTTRLINRLFDENFDSRRIEVHYDDGELIMDDYGRFFGDRFITIRHEQQLHSFHAEFQTLHDDSIAIRLFRYGLEKAIGESTPPRAREETVLTFPKQIVICLEESGSVGDSVSVVLRLPDGHAVRYTVPVLRYWLYDAAQLHEQQLHALLPLQAFKSRKRLKAIAGSKKSAVEKQRLIIEELERLKQTIRSTMDVIGKLYNRREILLGDLNKMLRAIQSISQYLYASYGEYEAVNKEMKIMMKTLIDPKLIEQGRREGKKEGKKEGKREGVREILLELLHERGELDAALRTRIVREKDLTVLKQWIKVAAATDTMEEFTDKMSRI